MKMLSQIRSGQNKDATMATVTLQVCFPAFVPSHSVGHPLLTAFNGIPYIDVRVDFNSWIPADLNPVVAEKLVNYYLQKLQKTPENHDKVEFEILYTNFYPGLHERLLVDLSMFSSRPLLTHQGCNNTTQVTFSDSDISEIEQSLSTLTHKMLVPVADQVLLIV